MGSTRGRCPDFAAADIVLSRDLVIDQVNLLGTQLEEVVE